MLTPPLQIPARPDMIIIGVSSILNLEGNIIQSIVHFAGY